MTASDSFETIARHARREIPKIKGSRFIGDAFPVENEDEAKSCITKVSTEFADATHHCFAFSIDNGDIERSSDAGEPGGTAGPPILRQIQSNGLTNVLVVVTRYYGGTNLGKGGLVRAYGSAAKAVLRECERVTKVLETTLKLTFDYDDTSAAMRTIDEFNGRIVSSRYKERTSLEVALPASRVDAFIETFRNSLSGRGVVENR